MKSYENRADEALANLYGSLKTILNYDTCQKCERVISKVTYYEETKDRQGFTIYREIKLIQVIHL